MCAIVDVNVFHELFSLKHSEAGVKFFQWINCESGRLVVGGKLLDELKLTRLFQKWAQQAPVVTTCFGPRTAAAGFTG